jgi:hypothetical protein
VPAGVVQGVVVKVGKTLTYPNQPVCRCGAPLVVGRAVAHESGCPEAAARRRREEAVAALVVSADTGPEAWEALGDRPKTQADRAREARAQDLADAVQERSKRIDLGRAMVASGHPLTPAVLARFTELHLQRLGLRWKLEACVFPKVRGNVHRLAALADEECHAVRAATKTRAAVFPSEDAQTGMHALNAALASGSTAAVEEAAREAVRSACAETYTARDKSLQEAT